MIDESLLDRVAEEYLAGRRLFIGTTNLDSNTFTLWDMGAIAASGRPDRLQRYRDVVLASASAPVVFSPVYIPVEAGGGKYWQMHADGGMKEGIMTYGVPPTCVSRSTASTTAGLRIGAPTTRSAPM